MTYTQWTPRRRRRRSRLGPVIGIVVIVLILLAAGAIATNALGAGERWEHLVARVNLVIHPVPDRSIPAEAVVTDPPAATPTPDPTATPRSSGGRGPSPRPTPTPTAAPARVPVDLKLPFKPASAEVTQLTNEWCAVAGTQGELAADGPTDNPDPTPREEARGVGGGGSPRGPHNSGRGPRPPPA